MSGSYFCRPTRIGSSGRVSMSTAATPTPAGIQRESKRFLSCKTRGISNFQKVCYNHFPQIRDDTVSNLLSLRRRLGDHFGDSALASVKVGFGSTPSCSQVEGGGGTKFDDLVGEMHPGNYVFYDAMQWEVRTKMIYFCGKTNGHHFNLLNCLILPRSSLAPVRRRTSPGE